MTQEEFAAEFNVDPTTVSRWERGKLHPSPGIWKRIREIGLHIGGPLADETVAASPVMKRISTIENLKRSRIVSKGFMEEFHILPSELANEDTMAMVPRSHSQYDISTSRMYDMIAANSRWLMGGVIYVEAHAYAVALQRWVDVMVTPLPDRDAALIEAVLSRWGEWIGFRVHFVYVDGLKKG